jgi:hypothetical protein
MVAPPEVLEAAAHWDRLTRWERAELGRRLRRDGWTYTEIMEVLPVVKGTLAGWCKEIRLGEEQVDSIRARRPPGVRTGIPVDTQRKRRAEIEAIRERARASFEELRSDPTWVAGATMYWAEGAKTSPQLGMANTDPKALRLFIRWYRAYFNKDAEFVLSMHLHHGNDEMAARQWWAQALDLPEARFTKTFIKPPGTGHRKNRWLHGVCRVQARRSADAYHATMAWIECLSSFLTSGHL